MQAGKSYGHITNAENVKNIMKETFREIIWEKCKFDDRDDTGFEKGPGLWHFMFSSTSLEI